MKCALVDISPLRQNYTPDVQVDPLPQMPGAAQLNVLSLSQTILQSLVFHDVLKRASWSAAGETDLKKADYTLCLPAYLPA